MNIKYKTAHNNAWVMMDMVMPDVLRKIKSDKHTTTIAPRLIALHGLNGTCSNQVYFGAIDFFCTNGMITGEYDDIRRKSASYEIIGRPDGEWGSLFGDLATNVAEAPPHRPTPLTQDGLLELFDGDTVGRDVVLQPASLEDLCNVEHLNKPSLEVIYDTI